MKIIGLTGPSGSGKGTSYNFFEKLDIPCIDTDQIYHQLLIPPSKCIDELVSNFSVDILFADGSVNRTVLAQTVFSDKSRKKLELLNKITHKYVKEEVKKIILGYVGAKKAVVIDAPLLFESGMDKDCDFTIAIISDEKTRITRIMERDFIDHQSAEARTNAQKPLDFYISKANYTVNNDSTINELENKLTKIMLLENLTK